MLLNSLIGQRMFRQKPIFVMFFGGVFIEAFPTSYIGYLDAPGPRLESFPLRLIEKPKFVCRFLKSSDRYVRLCVYVSVYQCVYVSVCLCLYVSVYLCVYVSGSLCVSVYLCV